MFVSDPVLNIGKTLAIFIHSGNIPNSKDRKQKEVICQVKLFLK